MDSSYLNYNNSIRCSGCSACANICAQNAIAMKEDGEGFLYPAIDKDKCIECGLCEKTCPYNTDVANKEHAQHSYIAITNRREYYDESASIGVCTMLAELVIKQGGYVFGVELNEEVWKAFHVRITKQEDLGKIRNSKYLQSDPRRTYVEVKELLECGKQILYIGTPCQIAGLKSFLSEEYDNLYTVDLFCHGVFSPKLMPLEIKYWERKFNSKVHNFRFRSKRVYKHANHGMVNFDLDDGTHIERHGSSSPTYHSFAYSGDGINYNLRPACYACLFRSKMRYGDITVGDPWFVKNELIRKNRIRYYQGARSVFCSNTPKGERLLAAILPNMTAEEHPHDELFCQPAVLPTNREIPAKRTEIYAHLEEDYGSLIQRTFNCNLDALHEKFEAKYQKKYRQSEITKTILRDLKNRVIYKLFPKYNRYRSGLQWWWLNCIVCNFPSVRFRRFCLRCAGVEMSSDVRFFEGFHVRCPENLIIGDGSSIGPHVLLDAREGLTLGKSVTLGYECIIWTLNHDYNDIDFCAKGGPVRIGDYAWICSRSIILPGITIGEGAVVASGAVVTKDVPPYAIVAGIPAKVIGHREKKAYRYGYSAAEEHQHFI